MEDPRMQSDPNLERRLAAIEERLAANQAALDELLARSRGQQDFIDELRPIAMSMMRVGQERLGAIEQRGYLTLARSAARVLDRVATSYTAEDVDALGESVVAILDTVRAVTQPEILALVQEGAESLEEAEKATPIGVVGLARASGDVNVQKGLGVLVAGLRHLGRASRVLGKKARGLRAPAEAAPETHHPAVAPPLSVPPTFEPSAPFPTLHGLVFDGEGFLVDSSTWTREAAEAIAADLGLHLSERHWVAIATARHLFEECGKSPNIRSLTSSCDIGTKELYQLFPQSPGKTVARIAGITKPVGCL